MSRGLGDVYKRQASNTGPALTARFEANTEENLEIIMDEFRTRIAQADPDLELNF